MAVNGDTGEVIGGNKLAQDIEKTLNNVKYPTEDGTYEDMYFRTDAALNELIREIRRVLFKHGVS